MKPITKESVERMRERKPKRIYFERPHGPHASQPKETPDSESFGTFNVPFGAGFKRISPFELFPNQYSLYHKDPYWRRIWTKPEFDEIDAWVEHQGSRVFLRDCLYVSVALSLNRDENTGKKTKIGLLVYRAKRYSNWPKAQELAGHCVNAISNLHHYMTADLICAVPPTPSKSFDLPSEVASIVSGRLGKDNITGNFCFGAEKKKPLKKARLYQKWASWDEAKLSFNEANISGKRVVLIDDLYQSGTTMQYIAMKLQEAGAYQICGLSMVKTMRDKDNQYFRAL